MKTTHEIINSILTAPSAQPTKEPPRNTKAWAEWLKFNLHEDEQLAALVDACAAFTLAMKQKQSQRWISLLGNSGTGKTHCAKKLWDYAIHQFRWTDFEYIHTPIYWPVFVRQLRAGDVWGRLQEMSAWPVLFLDDIGAERDSTGFASEQLNALIGSREGRWTILTSNLMLDQLAKIDPRIADRVIRAPNHFVEVMTQSHSIRSIKPF